MNDITGGRFLSCPKPTYEIPSRKNLCNFMNISEDQLYEERSKSGEDVL